MNPILIKAVAILALLATLFFGERYIESMGYDRAKAEDSAAMEKQKKEAAATLAGETAKVRAAEQALQETRNHQELQDADHQKTVADLSDRLRRAAGPAGRLRDPHAAGCGAGSGGATGNAATASGDSAADPAQSAGLLSVELTGLLQRLTSEADEVNNAYASCQADALAVRATP